MMFQLLHAGIDTLDVAFKGALPPEQLAVLEKAKEEAAEQQEPALASIGPGNVDMHVADHGRKGGYAFVCSTGPLGGQWLIKNNPDPTQWNLFASPRAAALLAYGYEGMRDRLFAELESMGARISEHSINRVDFAMDFHTTAFELHLDQFVAHAHAKVHPRWGKSDGREDRDQPDAVARGRRLESVTVGKMPGRQVIVYDKRREAIERQKPFWFKAWDIDRNDASAEVWRVEIRAGKKELKDTWQIRTFDDLESAIGDVCRHALDEVRYLADKQTDSNVTRQTLHPLWIAAQSAAERELTDYRSGLVPGQIKEVERDLAIQRYAQLSLGNAIGYGVSLGLSDEQIAEQLPSMVAECAQRLIEEDEHRLAKSIRRTRKRLHFLESREV